jgi:ribosomal subunit interface protein
MDPSEPLSELIREQLAKLEEFDEHMVSCHVVVEEPTHHHRRKHFKVEVIVPVKGAELVAGRDPQEPFGENAYEVVRDSFRALRRQLQDHVQRSRREVKKHSLPV